MKSLACKTRRSGRKSATPVLATLAFVAGFAFFARAAGGVAPSGDAPFSLGPPPGGRPVGVRASFHLQSLNVIDDESERFEFSGVLTLRWFDPRQVFDPAIEGVEEKVYQGAFQSDEISPSWFPQMILANASGLDETNAVVMRARPDGSCTLIQTVNAAARTGLDLRRYPFDRQRLEAVFELLGFGADEVVLQAEGEAGAANLEVLPVPQWSIEAISAAVEVVPAPYAGERGEASALVLRIDVRRQSFFTLRLVILPLALIVMLSWSVFWMDRSSLGDRMSVSFIGVLTAVAYQWIVGDILPEISYITLTHGFLSLSFFMMIATVPMNLVIGACEKRGREELGHLIDRRCRWIFPLVYAGLIALTFCISFFVL